MGTADFEFSFDMTDIDRLALLENAAKKMDAWRRGTLSGGGKPAESAAGKRTRAIKNDQAMLSRALPDIYEITDQDFLARDLPPPVRFTQLAKDFKFYWIRPSVGLRPELNWAFNMIEVRLEFNQGGAPQALPKVYQILPAKQFQTLLKADVGMEVRLNENFEFEATSGSLEPKAGDASMIAKADVDAVVKASAGSVVGPFNYHIKKAKIDHNDTGMEWVFWRLHGAEFFQEDSPKLVVIAQVPKKTKNVKINAALQAYRYFNYGAADWQQAVKHLPELFKSFFETGAPLRDECVWDITPRL